MKIKLERYIKARVNQPREDEVQAILDIFIEKKFNKGAIFKRADTISKELGFIASGSARLFIINNQGEEITGAVSQRNEFLSDTLSSHTNQNTPICIEILENSNILIASLQDVRKLLETNLTLNILFREYLLSFTVDLAKKQLLFINGTAKDRYDFIVKHNPELLQKFPLKFIASIIGITPTQLSRIRKQK